MEGLQILDDSIGPTGYPRWLTEGMDAMGAFEVESYMDYALEALEKARAGEQPPGRQFRVVRVSDAPLENEV